MECQTSDSKKIFKVFDASKRKRTRKKREGVDDNNSAATDDSNSACHTAVQRVASAKASLQDVSARKDKSPEAHSGKRDRDSSPSVTRTPDDRKSSRSPRRHRRPMREGISLALKAGLVSTPRSNSPTQQEGDAAMESLPKDQDSFIYAFLEEAIKRDKKKQKHARRHEERRAVHESPTHEHRHHHRRRHEEYTPRGHDKPTKEECSSPPVDQAVLFESFAKFCAQMNDKTSRYNSNSPVPRTHSHKSLQCEVVSRREHHGLEHHPVRLRSRDHSRDNALPSRIRSQENCRRFHSRENIPLNMHDDLIKSEKCHYYYEKDTPRYASKVDVSRSRMRHVEEDKYRDYPPDAIPTRTHVEHTYCRSRMPPDPRDYRDYNDHRDPVRTRQYEDDKRKCDQKTSRSFDVHREAYVEDDRYCRRTARSDTMRDKHYNEPRDIRDKRFDDRQREKYYEEKAEVRERHLNTLPSKDRRSKRNLERFERNSIASKEDDYRERDRYSERERDSGLSVADGENSTMSGRSNCLRVVKQEIAEQREAMDKMMKLWKELMRCFKGISQTQGQDKAVHESAANVRESAAAQLRLWRECMRRYETVARDVGDTDAKLMEEIGKQRSEMAEMATMWQECLQRYRDMSNDFNNLKQQLSKPESPTRVPAPAPQQLVCAEGEGTLPVPQYRLPPHYPQMPPMPGYGGGGSPLRTRASAPPAWWWCPEGAREPPPRRRSSPDSRGSRERDRRPRHKDRDRDDSRYKEKSKPNAARSEHRHRKR